MSDEITNFSIRYQKDLPSRFLLDLDTNVNRLAQTTQPYAVTGNYTYKPEDKIDSLQVSAASGAISITLPPPNGNRRRRVIKTDSSANTVTLVGTINGAVNYVLNYQYEFVTVEATGTAWLIIGRGTLTPSFNSVSFPSTQVPSSDPNTLDDYEEGTWIPSIGGSATYTTQTGYYTKIGRLVNLQGRLKINSLGTGSGTTISGLPFAAAVETSGSLSYWATLPASYVFVSCYIPAGGLSTIRFLGATAAAVSLTVDITAFQNGADVFFNINYHV